MHVFLISMFFIIMFVLIYFIYARLVCKDVGGISHGFFEHRFFNKNSYLEKNIKYLNKVLDMYDENMISVVSFENGVVKFSNESYLNLNNKYYDYGYLLGYNGETLTPTRLDKVTFFRVQDFENYFQNNYKKIDLDSEIVL